MSRVKNVFRGKGGFTLIELLIVIVIIGILAAIAIPNLADLLGTADRGAVESEMRQLLTDITAHRAQYDGYPDDNGNDWFNDTDFESQAADSLENEEALNTTVYVNEPANDDYGDFVAWASPDDSVDWNSLDDWVVIISEERGFESFDEGVDVGDEGAGDPDSE